MGSNSGMQDLHQSWQIMKSVRSKRAREKMQVFGQPLGLYSLRATGMESVACLAGGQVEAHVLLQ